MLDSNRPTAAEMRAMRADAARVREQHQQRDDEKVLTLPRPVEVTAVAS